MLLWFGNDRAEYLQAVYQLETMKADLMKMKIDLERIQHKRKLAESQIDLINTTLEYLRDYARIITMREYQKLKFQLAGEYEIVLNANRSIPIVEKQIRIVEGQIEKLERIAPTLKFKLLEFKKRD